MHITKKIVKSMKKYYCIFNCQPYMGVGGGGLEGFPPPPPQAVRKKVEGGWNFPYNRDFSEFSA